MTLALSGHCPLTRRSLGGAPEQWLAEAVVRAAAGKPFLVMIVDDHPFVREGIAAVLARCEDILIVASVGTALEAMEALAAAPPEVVLLDLHMPGTDTLALLESVRSSPFRPEVIVLAGSAADHDLLEAQRRGAAGFVRKTASGREIAAAIRHLFAPSIDEEIPTTPARRPRRIPAHARHGSRTRRPLVRKD